MKYTYKIKETTMNKVITLVMFAAAVLLSWAALIGLDRLMEVMGIC